MNNENNITEAKVSRWLIFGLFIVIIILLMVQKCNRNNGAGNLPAGVISTDTVVKTKVEYRIKKDTLYVVKYRDIKPKPIPEPVYIDKTDSTIRQYNDSFTTPDLTLFYEARTRGELLGLKPSYRLKSQKIIEYRDSIYYTTKTITTIKERGGLFVGLTVGFSVKTKKPEAGVNLMFTTKKGLSVGYSYMIYSNAHYATVMYRVFPRNK